MFCRWRSGTFCFDEAIPVFTTELLSRENDVRRLNPALPGGRQSETAGFIRHEE